MGAVRVYPLMNDSIYDSWHEMKAIIAGKKKPRKEAKRKQRLGA
jgi:hypothetical protein